MTRLAGLDDKTVASEAFGLTNYDQLQTDIDYLVVAGSSVAALGANNTVAITSEFHHVTVASGNIDNITDAAGASAMQQVRLWFDNAQAIRNNGGGAGNIRTLSGADVSVPANSIIEFTFDGTSWRPAITPAEIAYTQFTSAVNITHTTEGTADTIVTASAITVPAAPLWIEFFSPAVIGPASGTSIVFISLFEDGSAIGQMGKVVMPGAAVAPVESVFLRRKHTPAAGSRTYSIRAHNTGTATPSISAGAGGSAALMPGYIRVSTAA